MNKMSSVRITGFHERTLRRLDTQCGNRLKVKIAEFGLGRAMGYSKLRVLRAPLDRRRPDLQFQRLLEHSVVGVGIIQDGRFLYLNPKYCEIFGYSRDELLQRMPPLDLVAEPDRPAVERSMRRRLEGSTSSVDLIFKGKRKDGSLIDLELHGGLMEIDGRPALIGSLTDITERVRTEGQLRAVIEQNVAAIFVIRDDLRIGYVNRGFAEMLGYLPTELEGRPLLNYIAEADRPEIVSAARALLSGDPTNIQVTAAIKRKTGELVDVLANGALATYQGKPAIFGVAMDITERKRAGETRAQLSAIIECAHGAIVGIDLNGMVTTWNPGAAKLFGYEAEEMLGHPIELLAPDHRKQEARQYIEAIIRGDDIVNYETVRIAKDGREIDVSVAVSPIRDRSGALFGASAIMLDIGERKKAERDLAKTTRALRTLSHANEALMCATSQEGLLQEMCRVSVEVGGYRMAWIGVAEQGPSKSVRPVARAGYGTDYLDQIKVTWADDEYGRGPGGTAIRTGKIQVSQDFAHDQSMTRWRAEALERGYASAVALPLREDTRIFGHLAIYASEPDAFGPDEVHVLAELADGISYGLSALKTRADREAAMHQLEQALEETVEVVASTIEMRDSYTAGHQRRVAKIAEAVAANMGLPPETIRGLHLASIVHDLGKINVPSEILSKPGKLTRAEYELIKTHPQAGYDILKSVKFPWPIADIVLQHHERLDGSGYPNGLKGDAILLEAKIMAVADVVESMMSHRPYRPALGLDAALGEIQGGSGRLYDPAVVDACARLLRSGQAPLD